MISFFTYSKQVFISRIGLYFFRRRNTFNFYNVRHFTFEDLTKGVDGICRYIIWQILFILPVLIICDNTCKVKEKRVELSMVSFRPFRELIKKRGITTYYLRNKNRPLSGDLFLGMTAPFPQDRRTRSHCRR